MTMTIPAALRLDPEDDFPSQPERPRAGSPVILGAAAVLLLGSVGGGWLLGRQTASAPPAKPQVVAKVQPAPPIIEASASAVLNAPQTPEGATRAATSFLSLYFSLLDQPTDEKVLADLDGVIAETADDTVRGLPEIIKENQASLAGDVPGYISFSPLTYSVDYAPKKATVKVWSMYLVAGGVDKVGGARWFTSDIMLVRQGDQWLVKSWRRTPGPTPQNVGELSTDEQLSDVLAGRSEYRFSDAAKGAVNRAKPEAPVTSTTATPVGGS